MCKRTYYFKIQLFSLTDQDRHSIHKLFGNRETPIPNSLIVCLPLSDYHKTFSTFTSECKRTQIISFLVKFNSQLLREHVIYLWKAMQLFSIAVSSNPGLGVPWQTCWQPGSRVFSQSGAAKADNARNRAEHWVPSIRKHWRTSCTALWVIE